jgi:plasmid maintenance system antidote protein VapI
MKKLLGTTPELWLDGQRDWDLWHVLRAPTSHEIRSIESVSR